MAGSPPFLSDPSLGDELIFMVLISDQRGVDVLLLVITNINRIDECSPFGRIVPCRW